MYLIFSLCMSNSYYSSYFSVNNSLCRIFSLYVTRRRMECQRIPAKRRDAAELSHFRPSPHEEIVTSAERTRLHFSRKNKYIYMYSICSSFPYFVNVKNVIHNVLHTRYIVLQKICSIRSSLIVNVKKTG